MAKAKKSESSAAPQAETTGKKKAAKAVPAKSGPSIDTGLAAAAAAKSVIAGMSAPAPTGEAGKDSNAFRQFKQNLNKPASGGLAGILEKTALPGLNKPNTPFHTGKQVGRNQTFGADVNRTGVPRRTGGG